MEPQEIVPSPSPCPEAPKVASKKPYSPPQVVKLGDLRSLTMGVSPGLGESGNPAVFRI